MVWKTPSLTSKQNLRIIAGATFNFLPKDVLNFAKSIHSTKLNAEDVGVDPFKVATTIASFCNYIFRRNFLKPKTIAIIPDNGYNPKQKTSIKCQLCLKYLSLKNSIFIQHAKNTGEKQCGKYFLDGLCEQNKTIYEFHGCYWHGCKLCYNALNKRPPTSGMRAAHLAFALLKYLIAQGTLQCIC